MLLRVTTGSFHLGPIPFDRPRSGRTLSVQWEGTSYKLVRNNTGESLFGEVAMCRQTHVVNAARSLRQLRSVVPAAAERGSGWSW